MRERGEKEQCNCKCMELCPPSWPPVFTPFFSEFFLPLIKCCYNFMEQNQLQIKIM